MFRFDFLILTVNDCLGHLKRLQEVRDVIVLAFQESVNFLEILHFYSLNILEYIFWKQRAPSF